MARRGRPRKTGRRYANGHLVAIRCDDTGTPQLVAKRKRMVGPGGDSAMATSPVDVLATRGLIDRETHLACSWFGGLAITTLGRAHGRGSLDFSRGSTPAEAVLRRAEIAYAFICETIGAVERGALLEMIYFAICPIWLTAVIDNGCRLSPQRRAEQAASLKALGQLTDVYKAWRDHGPNWR
jgi:hypothetical protein